LPISLIDGDLKLRHLLRLSQLIERHSRQTLLEPFLNPLLPISRHRFQQFAKIYGWVRDRHNFSYQRSSPVLSTPTKRIAERSGLNTQVRNSRIC